MISATLDYLRGAAEQEPTVLLDVESTLSSWVDDYQDTGRPVHIQAADAHCAPLRTQVSALRRCISNLVDNAVRYGGSASIRCIDARDQVCIEVSDAGPGIAEAELGRVLQPFYRQEASRNRGSGGVGLGLSIAHDIAQSLQGRLSLRNGAAGGWWPASPCHAEPLPTRSHCLALEHRCDKGGHAQISQRLLIGVQGLV